MADDKETTAPPTGENAPPSVEPLSPNQPVEDQPDVNPQTEAAVGRPDGNSVDASEDPNLGHAFEDQAHGVGANRTES